MANKSKQKRLRRENESILAVKPIDKTNSNADEISKDTRSNWWFGLTHQGKFLTIGIIALLSLGTLGAGLKYLDDDAKRELAKRNTSTPLNPVKNESLLNNVNPFLPAPNPTATPQLSKELIYAGSRLITVEDANANAAPPADLAIWRPSTGVWWVMSGQGSQQVSVSWGTNGDKAVPGDYDGDGKTDFAVYRASDGGWYILKSSTGDASWTSTSFGQSGDLPAQADYDGDGKTDIAVYRPSAGAWYLQQSASGFLGISFGLSNDIPTPADYDGDGRADVAFRRGSDQTFYVLRSSNNQYQSQQLGNSTDAPVSADYDGDGKADYAVRNAANWIIRNSSNGQTQTISWQSGSDKAVYNDYDGDGKVDVAVWRNSDGNWFIRQSSRLGHANELRQVQWGTADDIPVPAYYRR